MKRRTAVLIAAAGLAGHVGVPQAQPAGVAPRRIGVLSFGTPHPLMLRASRVIE